MTNQFAVSTVGAKEISPARKRWDYAPKNFRSTVGATRIPYAAPLGGLFLFSAPTLRPLRLCVSFSLSSLTPTRSAT